MPFLGPGVWPYLAPYAAFLVLVELQGRIPAAAPWLFGLRVVIPAALLAGFWRGGAYRELTRFRVDARVLLDVLCGLAIAALWVGPYLASPSLARGTPFDPDLMGESRRTLALGLRLAGFALVTPFVEELFVRSFLLRYAEVFDRGGDFRAIPIGRFGWRGFLLTVAWFTFSHEAWEWWVALPTGIAFNAWLYWRRHLAACVIAHAVANAAIWALVVLGPEPLWEFL